MTIVLDVPAISQTLVEDLNRVGRKYRRWTPHAFFELDGAYLVEYVRGKLEILPTPSMTHQVVASRLLTALREAAPADGYVLFAGTRVKVAEDVFREPDVLYIPPEWTSLAHEEYAERMAIVIEVLGDSNRDHDLDTKRAEYATADIPEYWIVEPQQNTITVLTLAGSAYQDREFRPGETASSAILPGFRVDVGAVLAVR